ncbi:phytoene/squalene synthase family protein [Cytobacillus sp. FSL W7-1323]|uniref:phytoene/squalene synthase family protein n=1 Tax=Cytobacillus TaxID=2675230 RepID=UPI0027852BBD|nr:phytoene/squalene synthase family protein [Cytobacillus kochii]MDQ0186223.1 phytoene synthase [Cytobacillus kochii]MED1604804.1 phytoene/squalene synthase family protein [Cytobacillus kochii]
MNQQLLADYYYCEKIIQNYSNSFYYTFSHLPKEKANAVYAIYAFCRMADNAVDLHDSTAEKVNRLEQLHDELVLFQHNKELDLPLWRALRDVFNRYEMNIQPFFEQLEGQAMDISFKAPRTIDELLKYSYHVAGTVGLMLLPIIAKTHYQQLRPIAIKLGNAMQLTNILRDIGEDYRNHQRIYIPENLLVKYQYSTGELSRGVINPSFISIWEELAQKAESEYDSFETSYHLFDRDSQFQVLSAARVYRSYLAQIRNKQYNCFKEKHAMIYDDVADILNNTRMDLAN